MFLASVKSYTAEVKINAATRRVVHQYKRRRPFKSIQRSLFQ